MLPENFAETFAPERAYISILLKFFKTHKHYMKVDDISERTGIPQGSSSGKVVPHIKYMLGMHLIESVDNWYQLTSFGKAVFSMDRSISEDITAWCCHAFMCDNLDGAILYNKAFKILRPGIKMKEEDLSEMLVEDLDSVAPNRILSCFYTYYTKQTSFFYANILKIEDDKIVFNPVPTKKIFMPMFGAFVCHYLYKFFANRQQVSMSEFIQVSGILNWFGIKEYEFKSIIDQLAGSGYVKISNLVSPPVISPLMDEEECWFNLYSNIV